MKSKDIAVWTKGYLEALLVGDSISKQQLLDMIAHIQEMIDTIESAEFGNGDVVPPLIDDDFV